MEIQYNGLNPYKKKADMSSVVLRTDVEGERQ
jgi:hypothetical protein